MWIVDYGQSPVIVGTPGDSDIAVYLRRDYPDATLYRCSEPNAANVATAHLYAADLVETTVPGEPDENGDPTTVPAMTWQPRGNQLAIDTAGPALRLLDPDGNETGRLVLEAV